MNYIGSSLLIFDLDSHLNPNKYRKNMWFNFDNKRKANDFKRRSMYDGMQNSLNNDNFRLPPIK